MYIDIYIYIHQYIIYQYIIYHISYRWNRSCITCHRLVPGHWLPGGLGGSELPASGGWLLRGDALHGGPVQRKVSARDHATKNRGDTDMYGIYIHIYIIYTHV